ncbi:MAG: protein-tyrosine-phosphatase [Xanthomonadaceae bacterium]|nr:protein-tyrosine-phosphatase [Xanthomonadaceae bacterium]
MNAAPLSVLFLCTGNSARSILGEALINHPLIGRGRFRGYSAGSHPAGAPNPYALALLAEQGIAIEGLRSKSWDEFSGPAAPKLDFVFTVCDSAASEACPYWPGQPVTAHWGLPDPAALPDTDPAAKRRAFLDTFVALRRRIELLANLPLASLQGLALQRQLDEIGRA